MTRYYVVYLGADTKALGLSFSSSLAFRRIHELEGPHEDTFPDRGQTAQTAVTVSLCAQVLLGGPDLLLAGYVYVPVIFAPDCVHRLLDISQLCGSIYKVYVPLKVQKNEGTVLTSS